MAIDQAPFRRYHDEKKADSFTVKLNSEERQILEQLKHAIQQEKDSTAIKQLALGVAAKVILDSQTKVILGIVLNNYRKNKRLGIVQFE